MAYKRDTIFGIQQIYFTFLFRRYINIFELEGFDPFNARIVANF